MKRRTKTARRRRAWRRSNKSKPVYRVAIEILLVIAALEGAFLIINNYKKFKPGIARVEVVKNLGRQKKEMVKTQAPKPKVEPAAAQKEPQVEVKPLAAAVIKPFHPPLLIMTESRMLRTSSTPSCAK